MSQELEERIENREEWERKLNLLIENGMRPVRRRLDDGRLEVIAKRGRWIRTKIFDPDEWLSADGKVLPHIEKVIDDQG